MASGTPVVLDTNALLMVFKLRMNITAELDRLLGHYRILVPGTVLEELRGLACENKEASMALELASRFEAVETDARGDDGVLEAVLEHGGYLVTNDKDLMARARGKRAGVITLRQGTHLEIITQCSR